MRKETSLIEEGKFQSALNMIKISPVFYGLCSAVPVLVCIVAGPTVVNAILDFMPAWFTTGLTIAGGVLPGVGMAMLLMYMPLGKILVLPAGRLCAGSLSEGSGAWYCGNRTCRGI